jgi:quinol-cytochrome oxidoreductase complex cytochrome b subunit
VLALVSMVLPWFTVGGQALPATSGNGFDGAGIVVFVACVALLAVLALPYASRNGRSSVDRAQTYLLVAGIALTGFVVRLVQLSGEGILGLPDRAPGLWLGGAGLIIVAWGVAEILAEPAPAP